MGAETKQTGQREKKKKSIIAANLAKCNFDTVVLLPMYSGVLVACEAEEKKLSSTPLITVNNLDHEAHGNIVKNTEVCILMQQLEMLVFIYSNPVSGEFGCDIIFFCILIVFISVLLKHTAIIYLCMGCCKFRFYELVQGSTK